MKSAMDAMIKKYSTILTDIPREKKSVDYDFLMDEYTQQKSSIDEANRLLL